MLLLAAACGDDKHNPDAKVWMDAPADAPPDSSTNGCDYTEAHDATNDYNLASGFTAEETGIAFNGTVKTICGVVNTGHYAASNGSIDIDDYRFTVAADSDVLITMSGSASTIATFGVFGVDSTQKNIGGGYYIGNHAVFGAHLTAGTYEVSAEAYGNSDIAASVPYKIKIQSDMPATRCPKITAAANYTEANDGAGNVGNDVITINYNNNPSYALTALTTDAPEPAGTVAAGTNYRVSGTNAGNLTQVDSYYDKDTYQITTGATTQQVSVRLNWATTTSDLDLYIFQGGIANPPIATSAKMMLGEDEFVTFATNPNATYWLWVGDYTMSTANVDYDLSICAETFTP
ncbi:MAG: hypothetical protein ACM31C_31100 [Acidobacteriota bacterium]